MRLGDKVQVCRVEASKVTERIAANRGKRGGAQNACVPPEDRTTGAPLGS